MADLEELRREHDALVLLVCEKQDALQAIDGRLAELPGELVDASGKEARAKVVKELQTLRVERDVLALELGELTYRRDLALLTIHEVTLALAQDAYSQVKEEHYAKKVTWDAASAKLRICLNKPGDGDRQVQRERVKDLRIAEATTRAEMLVDAARLQDAGSVVERAKIVLEEVKAQL